MQRGMKDARRGLQDGDKYSRPNSSEYELTYLQELSDFSLDWPKECVGARIAERAFTIQVHLCSSISCPRVPSSRFDYSVRICDMIILVLRRRIGHCTRLIGSLHCRQDCHFRSSWLRHHAESEFPGNPAEPELFFCFKIYLARFKPFTKNRPPAARNQVVCQVCVSNYVFTRFNEERTTIYEI